MSSAGFPRYSPKEVVHYTGIEAYSFDEFYAQEMAPKVIYDCHRSNFYHLFRYTGRQNVHTVEGNRLVMGSNSLLLINQNILHHYSRHPNEGNVLLFSNAFFGNTQEKVDFLNGSPLFQPNCLVIPTPSAHCLSVVDRCHAFIKKLQPDKRSDFREPTPVDMAPHYAIMLRNWLHVLLLEVERAYGMCSAPLPADTETNRYIQQFRILLNAHYPFQKQVVFYATELGLTEKRLSGIVNAVHGLSAKEYICERILQEANWLLKYTTLSQGEIASRLGFNKSYFVRFFHKHTTVTPANYRKCVRANTLQVK